MGLGTFPCWPRSRLLRPLRAALSSKSPVLQAKRFAIPASIVLVSLCSFFKTIDIYRSFLPRESSRTKTQPCPGGAPRLGWGAACGGCLPGLRLFSLFPTPLPPRTLSDTCFWVPWANKSAALTARKFYKERSGFKVVGSSHGPQTWE